MQLSPDQSLRLARVITTDSGNDGAPYHVELDPPDTVLCPRCLAALPVIQEATYTLAHLPVGDHPVRLLITPGRARCSRCRTEQVIDWPGTDRHEELPCTAALARYVVGRMGVDALRTLAQRTGLSVAQVHQVQKAGLLPVRAVSQIQHLGLDEVYLLRQQHLVATDLGSRQLLKFTPVAGVTEGRAAQGDVRAFLQDLPDPEVITLDMHPEQLSAARERWPGVPVVIDKRHVLQVIDRDLLRLAAQVALHRQHVKDTELDRPRQQVLRTFGASAYPYLMLRSLSLRRVDSLSPAEAAAWTVIRRENEAGSVLWQAYLYRERLYQIYDFSRAGHFSQALSRWRREVEQWQKTKQKHAQNKYDVPLGRILWIVDRYSEEIKNYSRFPVTNSGTEQINALIRRYLRKGHRYNTESLMHLVNEDLRRRYPKRDDEATEAQESLLYQAPHVGSSQSVRVNRRTLPKAARALRMPPVAWMWLHSPQNPATRGGPRWVSAVMDHAAAEEQSWRVLCGGKLPEDLPPAVLLRWRATVAELYLKQRRLPGINHLEPSEVTGLTRMLPDLLEQILQLRHRQILEEPLQDPQDRVCLAILQIWQHLGEQQAGRAAPDLQKLQGIWMRWFTSVPPELQRLAEHPGSRSLVDAALLDVPLRWATAVEWAHERPDDLSLRMRGRRRAWATWLENAWRSCSRATLEKYNEQSEKTVEKRR